MYLKLGKRRAFPPMIIGLSIAAIFALAGCGSGGDSGSGEPINVAVSLSSSSLGSYVAAKEGFFKKNGLDAKLVQLQEKTNLVDGLGQSFDFGITYGPTVIAAAAKGLDIEAAAGANEAGGNATPDTALMLAPGSSITNVSQLAGKRIGAGTTNGITNLMTLSWLKQAGVQPDSVTAVAMPLGTMGDQLKAGRIAAAEAVEPYITQLKKQGFKSLGFVEPHVLTSTADVSVWAVNKTWAAQHKSVVTAFQKAQAEAITWIYSHRAQSNKILSDQVGVPLTAIESAPPPDYRAALTTNDISPFISMMKTVGWLKTNVTASSMVYKS